ncbi:MAG: hypothetical protein H0X13_15420 [Ramlibacter sp.]|nr:hypothetical protein [Ramlibacter sp.]
MKQDLIEALKRLARGHVDAAEAVAEMLMPEPSAEHIEELKTAPKKKAK